MDETIKDETIKEETVKEEILEQEHLEGEQMDCEVLGTPDSRYNEMLDKYQRSLAEFDNYRKRTIKEMSARYDDGIRAACEKLLPMVDNFERALAACEDRNNSLYQGVEMIARQFSAVLNEMGAQEIELEPGDSFDPNFHNAVAHVEDDNFGPSQVAEVLQKGYTHRDKVLRYSMVKVAN